VEDSQNIGTRQESNLYVLKLLESHRSNNFVLQLSYDTLLISYISKS